MSWECIVRSVPTVQSCNSKSLSCSSQFELLVRKAGTKSRISFVVSVLDTRVEGKGTEEKCECEGDGFRGLWGRCEWGRGVLRGDEHRLIRSGSWAAGCSGKFSQTNAILTLRHWRARLIVKVRVAMRRTRPNPARIRRARIENGRVIWGRMKMVWEKR